MSRFDAITSAFLHYLYADNHFRPAVAEFLHSPYAQVGGSVITQAELGEVLALLRRYELIATSGGGARTGIPARAGLTGSGLLCVNQHGGDVGAWSGQRRSLATILPEQAGAEVEDDSAAQGPAGGEVIAPRASPEQACTPRHALAGLIRVARVLLLTLPAVRAIDDTSTDVQQTATKLLNAAYEPDPDAEQVYELAQTLRDELTSGPVANTLGVVLLDSLDGALRESDLGPRS